MLETPGSTKNKRRIVWNSMEELFEVIFVFFPSRSEHLIPWKWLFRGTARFLVWGSTMIPKNNLSDDWGFEKPLKRVDGG